MVRKSVRHLLFLCFGAAAGVLADECTRFLGAGNRPSTGGYPSVLVPVAFRAVAESDKWLADYNIFFAPLGRIRSDSTYGLLFFTVKAPGRVAPSPLGRLEEFDFVGAGPDTLPFFLDRSAMMLHPDRPEVVLLDFFQSPRNWSKVDLQKAVLEVRSSPNPDLPAPQPSMGGG